MFRLLIPVVFSLGGAAVSQAALVYVDASLLNTFAASDTGSTGTPAWAGPSGGTTDGLWNTRTTGPGAVAFGANAFEFSTTETPPPSIIRTTVTGLQTNSLYTGLRLYYVGNALTGGANDWALRASVNNSTVAPGAFTNYPDNGGNALVDQTDSALGVAETGTPTTDTRYWVALPNVTTDASGSFSVWINVGSPASNRGVYDGIAYDTVPVPEPSIALLGLFGALGLLRRRR